MINEIELGRITYSDLTVYALAVERSAITTGTGHQVIQVNDDALYVLFDAEALQDAASEELARGLDRKTVQRSVLEVADYAAREFIRQS